MLIKTSNSMTICCYLSAQVDQISIRVVHWEHDPVRRVQLDHHDGVVKMSGSSKRILPLALLREPGGEDQPVLQVDGPRGLVAFVCQCFLLYLSGSWIHSSDLPIFAGEKYFGSVPVPTSGINHFRQGDSLESFARSDIPNDDLIVNRSCYHLSFLHKCFSVDLSYVM